MAHEELKALYEIDKQHSDTPWEFWESYEIGKWVDRKTHPLWLEECGYRRKPDAPVWDDDEKEDARKWRKLKGKLDSYSHPIGYKEIFDAYVEAITSEPALIQGYTAEQWQKIIDGKFLCEFSDDGGFPDNNKIIASLDKVRNDGVRQFVCLPEISWYYCRPLRIKGVRQPWFGGECPVDPESEVLARCLDDDSSWYKGAARNVLWDQSLEFIEL